MLNNIKNFIKKTVGYDPNQKTGQFGGTGSHIDDQKIQNEPNGYNSNQNIPSDINVDGGENTDRNANTIERDIQDWHTEATQDLLGNPQTTRPSKNRFENVNAQLAAQYFGNMK